MKNGQNWKKNRGKYLIFDRFSNFLQFRLNLSAPNLHELVQWMMAHLFIYLFWRSLFQFKTSMNSGTWDKYIIYLCQELPPLKVRMQLHKGFWSHFVPTFSDRQQRERQILVQNTNFYINVTSERTGDDNRKVVMKTFIDASWCITCIVWELGVAIVWNNFWVSILLFTYFLHTFIRDIS